MARRVARLDEQGFAEMSKVVGQTVDKLLEIEKQSAQRLRKHEGPEVPTVLIAMLFDAPDDDSLGQRWARGRGGAQQVTPQGHRAYR